jgi:hypothetical protein
MDVIKKLIEEGNGGREVPKKPVKKPRKKRVKKG